MSSSLDALATACASGKLTGSDLRFGTDLLRAARRGPLSEKQVPWVDRLVARANGQDAAPAPESLGSVRAIFELFTTARARGLKFPKVRLQTIDGQRIVFKQAGPRSKYAGAVQITDGGSFESGVYFGRIDASGALYASRAMTSDVRDVVEAFAAAPARVASDYGRVTGHCCFCSLPLSTTESVAVGYGPICAEKFDLPWGAR